MRWYSVSGSSGFLPSRYRFHILETFMLASVCLSSCPSGHIRHRATKKRREHQKSIKKSKKNQPKIDQNRFKIGPESGPGAPWGHLPPKTAPRPKKNGQNCARGPPHPWPNLGPKIDRKSISKPSKRNMFLNIFLDRVRTPPGTDFHRIWGPKMEPKSIQN